MLRFRMLVLLALVAAPVIAPAAAADHVESCEGEEAVCAAECIVESTAFIRWKEWILWVRRHCLDG